MELVALTEKRRRPRNEIGGCPRSSATESVGLRVIKERVLEVL